MTHIPLVGSGARAPSIQETAFNCPHCQALATQFWYTTSVEPTKDNHLPINFTAEAAEQFGDGIDDPGARENLVTWARKIASGLPFFEKKSDSAYVIRLYNVHLSKCFNCKNVAFWIGKDLYYPRTHSVRSPNVDLPEGAKADYLEAAAIVELSPRGAAALLRLSIQKLCIALGRTGRNINDDIATLVRDGLGPRIQQALDIVRVVGNNAVHPGEMDLRDDRTTAERLFELVNLIADVLISQPRHVAAMYDSLPEGARVAVERRDGN